MLRIFQNDLADPDRFVVTLELVPGRESSGRSVEQVGRIAAEAFEKENIPSLIHRLEKTWQALIKKGIDRGLLLEKSLLSPATCCLVNHDREKTVEKAFETIKLLSGELRGKYLHF